MALPPLRSMNGELAEGMTDGSRKKVTRDRGGFVEQTTPRLRQDINDRLLNIEADRVGVAPDGTRRAARGTQHVYPQVQY